MIEWLLARKLEKIGKRADPDPAFVNELERKLLGQTHDATFPWIKSAAVACASLTLFLVGTGSYAYGADAVLPDHPLYPIKTAIETAEEKAAFSPEKQARLRLKMAKRRLKEQLLLKAKGRPVAPEQMRRFVDKVESAIEANGVLPDKDREEFDRMTAGIESIYASALVNAREETPDESEKTRIDSMIKEQTERVNTKVETLQEKRKERFEKVIERQRKIEESKRLRRQDVPPLNRETIRPILPDQRILNRLPEL